MRSLFGPESVIGKLKTGLTDATSVHRMVADRVANALTPDETQDFQTALDGAAAGKAKDPAIEEDMVRLADTQIRYEATADLLREAYSRLRVAMRNNG